MSTLDAREVRELPLRAECGGPYDAVIDTKRGFASVQCLAHPDDLIFLPRDPKLRDIDWYVALLRSTNRALRLATGE